jgi:hypothetical protein
MCTNIETNLVHLIYSLLTGGEEVNLVWTMW